MRRPSKDSGRLSAEFERIVMMVEKGDLSEDQVVAKLNEIVNSLPKKRRGRPLGARSKDETPSMKRAWEYLIQCQEHKPSVAAKTVASRWGVDETTIYKDAARLGKRIEEDELIARHHVAEIFSRLLLDLIKLIVNEVKAKGRATGDARQMRALISEISARQIPAFRDGLRTAIESMDEPSLGWEILDDLLHELPRIPLLPIATGI